MDLIHKIESLRYDIENGVVTDVISISVRLIQIKDQALQLQQTGVMRWVSAKESLPLNDDEVLIFTINRDIVQAYLKDGKWKGSCMVTDNMNDGFVNDRVICAQGSHFDFVTHWMPLPTPPIA